MPFVSCRVIKSDTTSHVTLAKAREVHRERERESVGEFHYSLCSWVLWKRALVGLNHLKLNEVKSWCPSSNLIDPLPSVGHVPRWHHQPFKCWILPSAGKWWELQLWEVTSCVWCKKAPKPSTEKYEKISFHLLASSTKYDRFKKKLKLKTSRISVKSRLISLKSASRCPLIRRNRMIHTQWSV